MKRAITGIVVLLALVTLAACGDDDTSNPGAAPPQAPADRRGMQQVTVDAQDNFFSPDIVVVDAGTEVTWTNKGTVAHNVKKASETKDFGGDFGVEIGGFGPGESYSFTFDTPGVYTYTCTIHTLMDGEVRVEAGSPASSTSTTTG